MTINEIKEKVKEARESYNNGTPTISDELYDKYCQILESIGLEENYSYISLQKENKIKLPNPPLSLKKTYNIQKLSEFIEKTNKKTGVENVYLLTPKLDGVRVRLEYEDKVLKYILLKGRNDYQIDVTKKLISITPVYLPVIDTISLDGEIVISDDNFEKLKKITNKKYTDRRSAVVSTISDSNTSLEAIKCLDIVPHSVSSLVNEYLDVVLLKVGRYFKHNPIMDYIIKTTDIKNIDLEDYPYQTDGVVLSLNHIPTYLHMGTTKRYHKGAMALKTPPVQSESKLLNIIETQKDTKISYVGEIEPIELKGRTISKVNLYSKEFIEKNNIKIGATITVALMGDSVPTILL